MNKKAIFIKSRRSYLKSLKPIEQKVFSNETGAWCDREG
ncbi:unnamed protein product, partial [marine sediment metagenome]